MPLSSSSSSSSITSIVDSYLKHMNNIEKREAVSLLLSLGIKAYIQRDQSNAINIDLLRQLASSNSNSNSNNIRSSSSSNNNNNNNSSSSKKNYSEFDTTYDNGVNQKRVIQRPISRNNAMSHYPFTDNDSTVKDVITSNSNKGKLYDMGAPARKRFATSVFNDFLIDSSSHGIRVSDIPVALKALGHHHHHHYCHHHYHHHYHHHHYYYHHHHQG